MQCDLIYFSGDVAVTNELTDLEKTLQQTKKQFLATAKRATKELDRQRKRLRTEINKANTRAKRARGVIAASVLGSSSVAVCRSGHLDLVEAAVVSAHE